MQKFDLIFYILSIAISLILIILYFVLISRESKQKFKSSVYKNYVPRYTSRRRTSAKARKNEKKLRNNLRVSARKTAHMSR